MWRGLAGMLIFLLCKTLHSESVLVAFIELLQIYLHRNCLSWRFTADRPRRALLFVLLSIKPEDQQTHD